MYYLTLAMKNINISQVPGGSYSHPNGAMDLCGVDTGVDFFFCRTGYIKCIGKWRYGYNTYFFQPCDAQGRAVKVMCADGVERVVTLAMTHSNLKYVKTTVGKIYKQNEPIYEEGTMGKVTGNHIHLEVAEGTQTTKHYDFRLKVYRMNKELNPAKVFYIDTSFSKVINTKGLALKKVGGPICAQTNSSAPTAAKVGIAYGYNKYTKAGMTARTYRAKAVDGYDLHLLSAGDWNKVKGIASFDANNIVKTAVLNCNYFNLRTHEHYGVEQDGLVKGYTQAPKNAGLLVYYIANNGVSNCVTSDQYWEAQDSVQVAFTPYAVTMLHGQDVNLRSTNLASKAGIKNSQSVVARLKNGDCVLAAFENAEPGKVRDFFKAFSEDNVQDICVLDSGGSTQLRIWSNGKMQTVVTGDKRLLPNVLCLAKQK